MEQDDDGFRNMDDDAFYRFGDDDELPFTLDEVLPMSKYPQQFLVLESSIEMHGLYKLRVIFGGKNPIIIANFIKGDDA